jgi:galactose oxidase
VLTWSAYSIKTFGADPPLKQTITATLNPANLASSLAVVANTNHDMFCPGISMLGNGDIVVTGGDVAEKTSIYRVASNAWVPGADMKLKRGYQSSVTLSTGEVRRVVLSH